MPFNFGIFWNTKWVHSKHWIIRLSSWWLRQPIWKVLVKLHHFPNRDEHKKYLKPPARYFMMNRPFQMTIPVLVVRNWLVRQATPSAKNSACEVFFAWHFPKCQLWKFPSPSSFCMKMNMGHEKNPPTFHYTGWLIGFLTMVYYNLNRTGWYNLLYTLNNQCFFPLLTRQPLGPTVSAPRSNASITSATTGSWGWPSDSRMYHLNHDVMAGQPTPP